MKSFCPKNEEDNVALQGLCEMTVKALKLGTLLSLKLLTYFGLKEFEQTRLSMIPNSNPLL